MFKVHLLSLPAEIHHIIFDYIDTRTLVQSIPYVCKTLYEYVKNYKRFKLDCISSSELDVKLASRIIHPASVISLAVSDEAMNVRSFHKFFSIFDIDQFTRLRSLALREVYSLEKFLPLLNINNNNNYLSSLSIEFYQGQCSRSLEILSNVITRLNLKCLDLNNAENFIERITWPSQCRLTRLHIGICNYSEYQLVLRQSPYLKSFSLQNCIMNWQRGTSLTPFSSELVSLSINDCTLSLEDLFSILLLTPALTHLKIISSTSSFNSFADGSTWEDFITSQLFHLNKFEFLFSDKPYSTSDTDSPNSIIAKFQTPFWLHDKHWFVSFNLLLQGLTQFRIYTTPICTTDSKNLMRFEVSSRDSVWRVTKRSSAAAIDVDEDEVCIHV